MNRKTFLFLLYTQCKGNCAKCQERRNKVCFFEAEPVAHYAGKEYGRGSCNKCYGHINTVHKHGQLFRSILYQRYEYGTGGKNKKAQQNQEYKCDPTLGVNKQEHHNRRYYTYYQQGVFPSQLVGDTSG